MYVRIPMDRIGAVIGPNGEIKREIERLTSTKLTIDSDTGCVKIEAGDDPLSALKAESILKAIARGFSSQRAFRLLDDDQLLEIVDITDFAGDSERALSRLRGRVIGEQGKTRETIERMTDTYISIYGKTVAAIGTAEQLAVAREAIEMLLSGREHSTVYRFLDRKRREARENQLASR
ncbi:MAG: RNA-processing protein [Hadesarchaea archaeon]|nr:RNA-processing protein [Candidatus Bipolaricaulota bacterium]MBC7219098.1 RNA-processing protein [Hadesarchaea archaeon]